MADKEEGRAAGGARLAGGGGVSFTVFKDFVKVFQVLHDDVAVFFEDGEGDEEVEAAGEVVGPEGFPEAQDVGPFELALVPDEEHAEEEEKVGRVGGLEV